MCPRLRRHGQVTEDAGDHAQAGSPGKAVVECLVGFMDRRRGLPAQTVVQDVEDAAQHAPVIHLRLASSLQEVKPKPIHLRIRQPELSAHATLRFQAEGIG